MPYNMGMTDITLVLPFALPPSDLAPDLIKALDAPSLAALIGRAAVDVAPPDPDSRALPHENWLAQALGLVGDGQPAFATAAMRGYRLDPGSSDWFIVNPAHFDIARSHLSLADPRKLRLSDVHGRALYDSARPYFDELGHTLLFGDAQTWFMRAGDWNTLQTATPDNAIGLNLTDWLPTGPAEVGYRRLQNEIQMLWFTHPANAEREAGGLAAVNAFWIWGCAHGAAAMPQRPAFAVTGAAGWLGAMKPGAIDPATVFEGVTGDTVLLSCELIGPALRGDWATWLEQMKRMDQTQFSRALGALNTGSIQRVRLVLSHRDGLTSFTTTKWAQRAFWRSPSLARLLP